MITDVSAAACKHPTEKLMRGGLGAALRHISTHFDKLNVKAQCKGSVAAPRPQRGVWGVEPPKSLD